MNGLLWPIIGIMSLTILGLIGTGLWLIRADRAKRDRSAEPWSGSGLSQPQRPKPRQPIGGMSWVRAGCELPFGLVWTAFSLVFVVFSVGMFFSEWRTYMRLKNEGVIGEGVITGRQVDEDSEGDTYYVTYKYTAFLPQDNRQQFSHEESVRSRP